MCDIDDSDGEPAEVWHERTHTAHKRHRCDCCYCEIVAGETYLVHFSVTVILKREVFREKMCPQCLADRTEFAAVHEGLLHSPADFLYALDECVGDAPWGTPAEKKQAKRWAKMLKRINASRKATAA